MLTQVVWQGLYVWDMSVSTDLLSPHQEWEHQAVVVGVSVCGILGAPY